MKHNELTLEDLDYLAVNGLPLPRCRNFTFTDFPEEWTSSLEPVIINGRQELRQVLSPLNHRTISLYEAGKKKVFLESGLTEREAEVLIKEDHPHWLLIADSIGKVLKGDLLAEAFTNHPGLCRRGTFKKEWGDAYGNQPEVKALKLNWVDQSLLGHALRSIAIKAEE